MSKDKVKVLHNGIGWTGNIETEELYEQVKAGKADWKPEIKRRMTHVIIPKEVFFRLMELERSVEEKGNQLGYVR